MEPVKSRSLFHPRLSSAIEITTDNKEDVEELVQKKVTKGWRWVSAEFIHDRHYDHSRGYSTDCLVKERKRKLNDEELKNDLEKFDIVLVAKTVRINDTDEKEFFYLNSEGELKNGLCPPEWDAKKLATDFKIKSDGIELQCNPVFKARQMPKLKHGDWLAIQGKTLRVIEKTDERVVKRLKTHKSHTEEGVEGAFLPKHFFEDSYARLAGAYIRRLERSGYLKEAFEQFFYKKLVKLPIGKTIEVRLATGDRPCGSGYKSYIQFTLSKEILTDEDLTLLQKALGIRLDPNKLSENPTIENTVPFKKILEMLTCYNTNYIHPCNAKNVPILVNFQISSNKKVEFLLNADKDNLGQLIVSREIEDEDLHYEGNSYTYWLPISDPSDRFDRSKYAPDAATAEFVLNSTFAEGKEKIKDWSINKIRNLIEFLVCTQLVEAHATTGQLEESRVPGMGKLARALIKEAKENNMPLSDFFHAGKLPVSEAFYPMATKGGTDNGRDAVNTLKIKKEPTEEGEAIERENNAPDYDMSADSDVEFESHYQS